MHNINKTNKYNENICLTVNKNADSIIQDIIQPRVRYVLNRDVILGCVKVIDSGEGKTGIAC